MNDKANAKRVFWFDDLKRPGVGFLLGEEPDIAMDILQWETPKDECWAIAEKAHGYCITATRDEVPDGFKANAAFLARCPDLLVVSSSGAGYDPVDVDACTAAGVLVLNQAGANAEAVAEHAVGFMLSLTKNIPQTDRYLRTEKRDQPREVFKGWNARGKTVGIVGLGNTGRRTARICAGGLNMKVIAYDPYISAEDFKERGAESVSLEEVMKQSDFISVHCPLNAETKDMIDAKELAMMKPGAFIVSCARGGIVNEQALEKALKDKTVAGAGLDVWVQEPPPANHPLLKLDNVIATYHTAGVTIDSRQNMAQWNASQMAETLRGKRPPRLINPEAWDKFSERFEKIFGHKPEN
ncbi:MAG: hydroxyacid dehydrogenase [Rhodospirillales bacterium]|jgi:D-3-phosphoglycerate dehydrogenase